MKKLINFISSLTICLLILILGACQNVEAPSEEDEAAIRQLITKTFKAAWDQNDEVAMAASFLDDGDLTAPISEWVRGREAITQAFNWDLPEGRTIQPEIRDIRFLEPTVALVNVDASFQGGTDGQGNSLSDDWDCATWVMQKQ